MFIVFDMMGDRVKEDDLIVYSFSYSNSVEMRIGKVIDLVEIVSRYGKNHYLKVDWKATTCRTLPDKATKIKVKPGQKGNFLRLEDDRFN